MERARRYQQRPLAAPPIISMSMMLASSPCAPTMAFRHSGKERVPQQASKAAALSA
ncbi:hypothetical protein GCM10007276_04640 [Agaricicola taiwanensis]|uniref:Uncharacterized protein n=1 Tax=Agaricicola taiwanensis TaxID=591372 RepID=A0A8J2VL33_9RHOB|nr:hypothetical protein GCM10007276_04640 [Agaricicola taiwanensis]